MILADANDLAVRRITEAAPSHQRNSVGSPASSYRGRASLGMILLALTWPLASFLARMLTSGIVESVEDAGLKSDAIKIAPHLFFCLCFGLLGIQNDLALRNAVQLLTEPVMVFFWGTQVFSSVTGAMPWTSLSFVALLFILFLVARLYLTLLRDEEILLGLALFSLIAVIAIIPMAVTQFDLLRHREIGNLNSHRLGAVAMLCGCLSFGWRSKWLRRIGLAAAITTTVLLESRAALLGLLASVSIVTMISVPKNVFRFCAIACVLAAIMQCSPVAREWKDVVVEKALRFDDPLRGRGSGFTGRTERWAEAWELAQENLLRGSGPRSHVSLGIRGWSSAHNGYLVALLEVGLLGTLAIVLLFLGNAKAAVRAAQSNLLGRVLLMSALAFGIRAFFESELLNSVTVVTVIAVVWLEYPRARGFHRRPAPRSPQPILCGGIAQARG